MSKASSSTDSDRNESHSSPTPLDWASRVERLLHVQNDVDSHTEPDANTFHPSQVARCKRQATLSKLGLTDHDTETLGIFQVGTLIHEWLEDSFGGQTPGVHHEHDLECRYPDPTGDDEIVITGTADVWDEHSGVVYDFKTRSSWYRFDPPTERHLDQLTLYMDALDAKAGQIVYLCKKNLEVKTWPEDGTFAFDPDRRDQLLQKARTIRDTLQAQGLPETPAAVPFDDCGCWLCGQE